jgi:hypothetical protein
VRKYFLIFPVMLLFNLRGYSQADVSIDCQDQWGPGRYNKVSVSISYKVDGFARFTQDFPVGFEVVTDNCPGCDLSWTGNQLNIVFMDVKHEKSEVFSYYIKPEISMNGNFNFQGEVVIISDGVTRNIVKLTDKSIEIGGSNGILPGEMKSKSIEEFTISKALTMIPEKVAFSTMAIFRVQVSASSKVMTESRLRKDLGLGKEIKISVVKSGNIYKYQAGEYTDYDSAAKLLKKLKENGVKGAFLVAYREGKQVDLESARKIK